MNKRTADILLGLTGIAGILQIHSSRGSAGKTIPIDDEDYNKMVDNLLIIQTPILKRFLTGRASLFQYVLSALECNVEYKHSIIKDIPNIKSAPIFIIPKEFQGKRINAISNLIENIDIIFKIAFEVDLNIENVRNLVGTAKDLYLESRKNKKGVFVLVKNYPHIIKKWMKMIYPESDLFNHFDINKKSKSSAYATYSPEYISINLNVYEFYTLKTRHIFKQKYGNALKHEVRHNYEDVIMRTYNTNEKKAISLLSKMKNIQEKSIPQTKRGFHKFLDISKDDSIVISIFNALINMPKDDWDMFYKINKNYLDLMRRDINIKGSFYNSTREDFVRYIYEYSSKIPLSMNKANFQSTNQLYEKLLRYSKVPLLDLNKTKNMVFIEEPSFTKDVNKKIIIAASNAMKIREASEKLKQLNSSLEKTITLYNREDESHLAYEEGVVEQKTHIGDVGEEILAHVWDFQTDSFTTDPKKIKFIQDKRRFIWSIFQDDGLQDKMLMFGYELSDRVKGFAQADFHDEDRQEYITTQYTLEIMRVYKMIFDHYGLD